MQNLQTLAHHFPNLTARASNNGLTVHRLAHEIMTHLENLSALKLSWGDTLQQQHYIPYILSHLEEITASIVVPAFLPPIL